jgi:hypothetical protein
MSIRLPEPPQQKHTLKGQPPTREQIKDNLVKPEPEEIVSLNFRVSSDFKRDFKIASATVNITQSDLLQKIFRHWEKTKG